jgi:small conductance mechanosensitive channel
LDFSFSIGYSDDFEKAKTIVLSLMEKHELVLKDPAPMVRVSEHGASSINLTARAWVNSADYWTVRFDLLEAVKKAFDENGIEIPFNQLDVHVKKD